MSTTQCHNNSSWTYEDTQRLIEHVKKYPFIFDQSHVHYRNDQLMKLAWEDISKSLNTNKSANNCAKKWESLVQHFKLNTDYVVKTGETPTWVLFNSLRFLIEYLYPINSPTRVTPNDTLSSDQQSNDLRRRRSSVTKSNPKLTATKSTSFCNLEIDPVTSNERFFKMIATEMVKLSMKNQSKFRIFIMSHLHDLLFETSQ